METTFTVSRVTCSAVGLGHYQSASIGGELSEYIIYESFRRGRERVGLAGKIEHWMWGGFFFVRNGKPGRVIRFGGGPGDHLLCTAVAHELARRGVEDVWMMSYYRDLFRNNPTFRRIVPDNWRVAKYCEKLGSPALTLYYGKVVEDAEESNPPDGHIIADLCRKAGIRGEIELRPYLYLDEKEKRRGRLPEDSILVQNSGLNASTPMKNKEWIPGRMQAVVDRLAGSFPIIQVGRGDDPPLDGAEDLRGKTTFREAAAMASASRLFVGQVGFLMHLARAVETPAVIIYGGREKPSQSGYPCNENLYTSLPCSPCWRPNRCDYNRECLDRVKVEDVMGAIERLLDQPLERLACETVTI